MKVLVDFCIIPMGVGTSVSGLVAECERVLRDCDVEFTLHANGTNVEGEWDAVFGAIKRCQERMHELGVPRVMTTITAGTRSDREQSMAEKIASVEAKLAGGGDE